MSLENVQLHLVDNLETAQAFMTWLGERHDRIAVDTETTGRDSKFMHDDIRLIQFGDHRHGWAIPWEDWRGVALDALRRYEGRWVFFNAKYDVRMIEQNAPYTFDLSRVDDVMIKAHIDDPSGRHGLKQLTTKRVHAKAARMQDVLTTGMETNNWTWATVPITYEPYWSYGALDTVLTVMLDDTYDHVPPVSYDLEMGALWISRRMEDLGIAIDAEYTRACIDSLSAYVEEAHKWCMDNYGVRPGSNTAVAQRLQADGVVLTKLTNSGNAFALDREVLESIDHPLAATVLQRRRVDKLVGYLTNFIKTMDSDGILHPNIHPMMTDEGGARTGRMSITKPALQTLPRKSTDNPLSILVRNCFVARPGRKLVLCDFDQIEARMGAHFAQDPAMGAAFNEGDFFTNIARMIYRDASITKNDPRRQVTKNAVYAKLYGSGVPKFAQTAGITVEQGQAFMDMFDTMFPGVRRFQNEVDHVARQRLRSEGKAYVRSPLTGRVHVSKERKEYALVNYLVQGTAAEVFKLKLLELAAAGLDKFMVLPVHDEIILDVPAEDADDVAHTVRTIMCDDKLFTVPLTAGVDIVERWGMK